MTGAGGDDLMQSHLAVQATWLCFSIIRDLWRAEECIRLRPSRRWLKRIMNAWWRDTVHSREMLGLMRPSLCTQRSGKPPDTLQA